MPSRLVLVKHAQPALVAGIPPARWELDADGEGQAKRLARVLEPMMPFALACSREPKAFRTARILGGELGLDVSAVEGLHEFDRPALPLMTPAEHTRLNAAIFDDLSRVVIGSESGAQALARFRAGVGAAIEAAAGHDTLVAVAHGTVISLLVAAHNGIDAFDLWTRLQCPSFVVLTVPEFRLLRVEEDPLARGR